MATSVLKPVYLVDALGEFANIPDGAIINIGGVAGPHFLVGDKPLLFADGTATDGSTVGGISVDLQSVYDHSAGEAFITFATGKDLVFQAVNGKQFRFDADTGLVTITGDLTVLGESTTIITAPIDSSRVHISQTAGDYVPFIIEPQVGVTPVQNIVDIKITNGGASVFSISAAGVTSLDNLIVAGTINGIDIELLQQQFLDHFNLSTPGIRHKADQISIDTNGLAPISGDNVQEAIESIAVSLSNISASNVRAYEHIQLLPATTWAVVHGQNTRRIQITIWDNLDEVIMAESIHIADLNTVSISYHSPVTGRAILMLF